MLFQIFSNLRSKIISNKSKFELLIIMARCFQGALRVFVWTAIVTAQRLLLSYDVVISFEKYLLENQNN